MTTVIVTRPSGKQSGALQLFKQAGFEVFSAPCFAATTNYDIKAEWLNQASLADVVVVLNSHAIDACLDIDPNFCIQNNDKVLAIGTAVQQHWQHCFGQTIHQAGGNSEAVIDQLKQIKPKSIAVFSALGGRELIKSFALQQGINYTQINCYNKTELPLDLPAWQALLEKGEALALTVNSGAPLEHIKSQLPQKLWQALIQHPVVTGAQRISDMAYEMGFAKVLTANSPSNRDMLKTLL